jgi:hypothetical protein
VCVYILSPSVVCEAGGSGYPDFLDMDLEEIGWWYGVDRTGSGQGPVGGSCEHGDEPSGSLKLLGRVP